VLPSGAAGQVYFEYCRPARGLSGQEQARRAGVRPALRGLQLGQPGGEGGAGLLAALLCAARQPRHVEHLRVQARPRRALAQGRQQCRLHAAQRQ